MNFVKPDLDPDEWADVASAFAAEADAGSVDRTGRSGWCRRLAALVSGRTHADTGNSRQQAVRRFLLAVRQRQPAEPYIASLLSAGFNRRQVAALALLAAPPRGPRSSR